MSISEKWDRQAPVHPLAQDFSAPSLLKFAFPTIVMMVFMGLYTIVDTVFVARFVGTDALSAVNIVVPVINLMVGLGSMLASGGSAAIARKLGEEKDRDAGETLTLILLAGLSLGLAICVAGSLFLEPLVRMLGCGDVLFPYCRDYLSVLLIFAPACILQVLFQSLLVTAGRPGLGMWLTLMGGMANALFDFLLIARFGMGIRGAALATSLSYLIPTAAGILFFLFAKNNRLRFCRPCGGAGELGKICFNGSSEMVGQLSAAVTTFLFNLTMMRLLGENGVAAITIMIYSQFLLSTLYIGFSMGVAPVISYSWGSGNYRGLKRICRICFGFIGVVSIAVFVVSMIFGPELTGIFAPEGSRVYEIARYGFQIFPFSFLFCGYNIFASALFTALSNGTVSATLSFLRTFGFLTAALLTLPLFLQAAGVWLAVPAAELLTLILSACFVWHYRKQYQYL